MKTLLVWLLCYALTAPVLAQTFRAQNALRTRQVQVPPKVVRKFKKTYPDAQVDSCYVYGDLEKGEEAYMFYSQQQGRLLNVAFDKHGTPTESETEISVKELPQPLQETISDNAWKSEGIGKVYRQVGHRRPNEVEYKVECVTVYQGRTLKVPLYFNEKGYPAKPGFR